MKPGIKKLRVGVILGGRSGEHEVSLMSARSVVSALDANKYDVIKIGITRDGRWLTGDVTSALENGAFGKTRPATLLPDPQLSGLMELGVADARPATLTEVSELDVIIPVLHGPYGEDGTVQGLLELAGIPYVGAGVVGSAVGMDKAIFKSVMTANNLSVLPWHLVRRSDWLRDKGSSLDQIESALEYPMFTKPANLGSSVGISKCTNRLELEKGLTEAARFDRRLIIEQGIKARELEVSVLGNDEPIASVVGEVLPSREFYDYVAKYMIEPGSDEESEIVIPAELDPEIADNVRGLALKAFKAIDCAGLARVDFLLDKKSNRLFINELNTIPGFTRISMYPKLWEATGISYSDLLDKLIDLALERFEVKKRLETSFNAEDDI